MEYEIVKSNSFITFEEYIKNKNVINNDNSNWGFYIDIENQQNKNIIQLHRLKKKQNSNILKMEIIKEEDEDDELKFQKSNNDIYVIFGLLIVCVIIFIKF
jgi:hypothetical protein